ncbi:MAG: phosphoribosyl-ATP diphosphatase [Rhodospirillales bacterium]|nr:phosphoribosyl-ATP diphosphatase [Rhodospirillales bacterium]MBN8901166.1 phosphoribosyl-ATP diphosphatase [Rhodospirillales bacterium]
MPKTPKKRGSEATIKDKKRKPAKTKPAAKPAKSKASSKLAAPHESTRPAPPLALGPGSAVLDRLWTVVMSRRDADPAVSHSARLLSRGMPKVAQKFGEEAVECLIEAVAGNREALIAESADVLYHLLVVWVSAGVSPDQVWAELKRREGISGIAEKASRAKTVPVKLGIQTTKIP